MAVRSRRRGTRRLLVGVVGLVCLALVAYRLSSAERGGRVQPAAQEVSAAADAQAPPAALATERIAREGTGLPPLRLAVRDEWGRAVVGAVVRPEDGAAPLARSDDAGQAAIAAAALPEADLVVEHHGFAPQRLADPAPCDDPLEVVLVGRGAIEGRVLLPADAPLEAREGIRVLAYPRGCRPCASNLERLLAGDGDLPRLPRMASTAADGTFRVDGLRPDGEYGLVAGGAGFVTTAEELVRPDGLFAVLPLSSLYGVVAEFHEPDGTPVHAAPGVFAVRNTTWRLPREARAEYDARSPMAVLAGMPLDLARERDVGRRLYLFTGATRADGVGPVETHLHLAGYEPRSERLFPRHLGEPDWYEPTPVELTPTAAAWGAVHVRVLGGALERFSREHPDAAWGALVLRSESEEAVRLALWGTGAGDYDFDEVPAGEYAARFRTSDRFAAWPRWGEPDLRVSVGAGLATVTVDLRGYGALELDVRDPDGGPHPGWLGVDLTQLAGGLRAGMSGGARFRSGPYALPYLEPGTYRLDLPRTLGVEGDAADPDGPVFVVRAGEVTRLEVRLAAAR